MAMQKKNICYLFRAPGRFFSIERVFRQLERSVANFASVIEWAAPREEFSPIAIMRNLFAVRNCKADIYHVTGHIHYIVFGLPRNRALLTIHDCVFIHSTAGLKRRFLKLFLLDLPVRYCKLITTISETTRDDIIRYTGCSSSKIVVIPDPIDSAICYFPASFNECEPVILFIGTKSNKNLERVIPALEGISCQLDIVGSLSVDQLALLQRYKINYLQQSGLSDEEIAAKYARADVVLFPSTFEGFGLPIIEAQQAGRVVITSNISPMTEVAGGAACLVNPYEINSIRQGVLRVISDRVFRNELIEKGRENVVRFAPEVIAKQYMACYETLLQKC